MKISFRKFIGLVFLTLTITLPATGNPEQIKSDSPIFHKLNNDDGLSQGTINAIAQDNMGFIWIGTNDGLNRYDGYDIKTFRNIPGDTNSISSNEINAILCDNNGNIWIGTSQGLNRFDTRLGLIRPYNFTQKSTLFAITCLASDSHNNLWVGTYNTGFFYLDFINDTVIAFSPGGKSNVPDNRVSTLFVDSNNDLWVGFETGDICLLHHKEMICQPIDCGTHSAYIKSQNIATGIAEDIHNQIWISTYGRSLLRANRETLTATQINEAKNDPEYLSVVMWDLEIINDSLIWVGTDLDGLGVYNINTGQVTYHHEGDSDHNINYKTIKTIFQDRDQNIWIGTNGKGLNIISSNTRNFLTITGNQPETMKLNFSSVRSILFEDHDHIWVGGYVGLQKLDLAENATEAHYNNISYSLCQDNANENHIWIGNEGSGLYLLDKKSNKITNIPGWQDLPNADGLPVDIHGNNIYAVANKDKDHLYICSGAGFHIFNKNTWAYEFFKLTDPNSGTGEVIGLNGMLIDAGGSIWVTSFQGYTFRFDPIEKKFINVLEQFEGLADKISRVNIIFQSGSNQYWLGTSTGLFALNFKNHTYQRYTVLDGLPNDVVYGILEDANQHLWLSTNMGICKFNPESKTVLSFSKADGLPCNEFNSSAFAQFGTSRLVFGGVNGIVIFDPDDIASYPIPPGPVITDVQITGETTSYDLSCTYSHSITLKPEQEIFTMYFSSLQYFISHNNRYAIKIGEESTQWIDLGNERKITITSLPPGEHTIELKVSNNSGEWCKKPTKFHVTVQPYFYETISFKFIVAGIIALLVAMISWWRIRMIKIQNEKLEHIVADRTLELKQTNKELEKANQTKNKFFSIIAHDLKNPFNSMLGFGEILVDDWKTLSDEEKFEFVQIIRDTTEDTLQLLINLLEWSRIQKNEIQFKPANFKLHALTADVISQLRANAFIKNIRINIEIGEDMEMYADQNMIHTVLRNLISNAIKFTPGNGKISITANTDHTQTTCCVKDNGVGMGKEVADKLFDLQYRNTKKGTEGEPGTGLGLVLSHEFIKKHNGEIFIESEPGKGSTFCFTIPKHNR